MDERRDPSERRDSVMLTMKMSFSAACWIELPPVRLRR
jgi:hypothetical protein